MRRHGATKAAKAQAKKRRMPKVGKSKILALSEEQHPVRKALSEFLEQGGDTTLFADGFEDAIVGLALSSPGRPTLVVYDYEKCTQVLMKRDKMTWEDATEYLDFNTVGAWAGDMTPIFINTTKNLRLQRGL